VGGAGDLLHHVGVQDVVAFTGSGQTGATIRALPNIIRDAVRVNVEAGSETYELYLKDVLRDMTQKAGQKCTAIRRVLVPGPLADRVRDDLIDRLKALSVGNPAQDGVRMGPVATRAQREDVRDGINQLARDGRLVLGSAEVKALGVPEGKGFFVAPALVELEPGAEGRTVHSREVFGPAATIVPYGGAEEAIGLVARGGGGLVSSIYSEDTPFTVEMALGLAPYHGRLFLGSAKVAELSPGPGTVLPHLVHGGPGRAGGGEELGGLRGLAFYMQRVALEGARPVVEKIVGKPSS